MSEDHYYAVTCTINMFCLKCVCLCLVDPASSGKTLGPVVLLFCFQHLFIDCCDPQLNSRKSSGRVFHFHSVSPPSSSLYICPHFLQKDHLVIHFQHITSVLLFSHTHTECLQTLSMCQVNVKWLTKHSNESVNYDHVYTYIYGKHE